MSDHPPLEKVYAFTRTALPLMGRHGIPTTPLNYSVWYNYVTGENRQLNDIIDAMLKNGEAFTPEKSRDLYSQFCMVYDEVKIKTLQEGLAKIMVALFGEVRGLTGQTENYEHFLSLSLTRLTDGSPNIDFGKMIQDIIDETKAVVQQSKAMQEKLKESSRSLIALQKEYEQAKREATHDSLTRIFNRKAFQEMAESAMGDMVKMNKPLALIMADIDYFKYFNDTHGHLAGDEVLKFVAKTIKNMVKGRDVVARFGGEEFVILLPQTGYEGGLHVAEQIRCYFERNELKSSTIDARLGTISLSMGLAVLAPGDSLESLVERADQALYQAKEKGRNRVMTERHLN